MNGDGIASSADLTSMYYYGLPDSSGHIITQYGDDLVVEEKDVTGGANPVTTTTLYGQYDAQNNFQLGYDANGFNTRKHVTGGTIEDDWYTPDFKSDKLLDLGGKLSLAISTTLLGGRLFGLGYRAGKDRTAYQIFRIDYWDTRPYNGGINNNQYRPTVTPLHVHYHLFGDSGHVGGPDRTIWP